jgi:thymidylate synthase ThyX
MTITAKIISDSIAKHSPRLTTLQLRYPKFIHGEFLTHRVFSRNSSSSRAIPVQRLIQDVIDDPVIPIHWGANQKGMQADKECDERVEVYGWGGGTDRTKQNAWLQARDNAVKASQAFDKAGYHKQIVNRLIEPWYHINTIVTATEWSNFFALRRHKDAQPEMKALADAIYDAMVNSTPKILEPGEWHTPYFIDDETATVAEALNIPKIYKAKDRNNLVNAIIKVSVARCARVSYLTHDGKQPGIEADLKLYDHLVGSVPLHASPAEHQATPDLIGVYKNEWLNPHLHGNFKGWRQFRKTLSGECQ